MAFFRRFAFITTITTYILIFVGGLVRVSGAGLGCPDWPKCFGRWIPPLSSSQLPADIDPAIFNFTLAWIEYINRLFGMLTGLLIFATVLLAFRFWKSAKSLPVAAVAATLLTGFQGWYGSIVVGQKLNPLTVSVHMGLALIIVTLLIYVTQQAYYRENPDTETGAGYPKPALFWAGTLWAVSVIQILSGTRVRAGLEIETALEPLAGSSVLLDRVGVVEDLHWLLGVIVLVGTWQIGGQILKKSIRPSPVMRQAAWAMMLLVLLQIFVGFGMVLGGIPDLLQLYHLWIASLYLGAVSVVMFALLRNNRST